MTEPREISPTIRRRIESVFDTAPRFRFWEVAVPRGARWRMVYTTELAEVDGRSRFLAILYRSGGFHVDGKRYARREKIPLKYRGRKDLVETWEETRTASFARRWKAKDRAWKWRCEKLGVPFESLHTPPRQSAAQRKNHKGAS